MGRLKSASECPEGEKNVSCGEDQDKKETKSIIDAERDE